MTRCALIRDASRRSLDEGTQWRDRLGKWLEAITPPIPIVIRWHQMGFDSYVSKELADLLKDVPQVTSKQYHEVKNIMLGK